MALSTKPNVSCLIILLMIAGATSPFVIEAAVTCDTVNNDLGPCIPYVLVGLGGVPSDCCDGLKSLVDAATTKPDRQTACSCLKSVVSKVNDDQLARAAEIPDKCGVKIPFKISRDVDCSAVSRFE